MTFLDLFSGIGGFRLGMEQAGHECVGHVEIDKYANLSYEAMHEVKKGEYHATDIRGIRAKELPEAEIYCAGFPCQSFSIAGKRGSFDDTRGTLFFEIMRLARERKPKYLFLENVRGLLSADGGCAFQTILNTLRESGYEFEYQVLNSKNYGVPQNRERVFIIGYLRGTSGRKVFPIRENDEQAADIQGQHTNCITAGAGKHTGGSYVVESEQYAQDKHGVIIIDDQGRKNKKHVPTKICPTLRAESHGNPPKVMIWGGLQKHQTPRTDGISPCLNSAMGMGGGHTPVLTDNFRIRKLTPKECFRLQGYLDKYFDRAASVNSNSQLYKQAGNSVTVNVIHEIAKSLKGEERCLKRKNGDLRNTEAPITPSKLHA